MPAPKNNKFAVGNNGGGRPSEYVPEYADVAFKLCLLGATDEEIGSILGFSEQTINNWKKKYEDFNLALKKGKTIADSEIAHSLYQRALGFEHDSEEIKIVEGSIERVKTRKIYPPDPTSAIFWLKNRKSKAWRDKQEDDNDDKPSPIDYSKLTDEELEILRKLHEKAKKND